MIENVLLFFKPPYIISIKKDYTGQNGSEWSLITLGPYEGWVPKRFLSKITKYQK
jgi:hypothetical protein